MTTSLWGTANSTLNDPANANASLWGTANSTLDDPAQAGASSWGTANTTLTPTTNILRGVTVSGTLVPAAVRGVIVSGAVVPASLRGVISDGLVKPTSGGGEATLEGTPAEFSSSVSLDENWSTFDTTRWFREASTYGSDGNRIQRYRHENVVVSAASSGGTGNSLKLVSKRESYIDRDFTAGMLGTRNLGVYYPRWGRYMAKMRIPHGHGVWPAFWLRHRDGSVICEPDIMEYFIAQDPGRVGPQLHRTNNSGTFQTNRMPYTDGSGRRRATVYESPVAEGSQGWITYGMDIIPWTASTIAGGTYGNPNASSSNVLFRMWKNGSVVYEYLDTSSTNWSQRYSDQAFDICLQGSQIGGDWIGHPDDPLGYSRWKGGGSCIVGGTAPNSCTTTIGGYTNRVADFPNTFEIDWVRVWKYEGAA